MGMYTELFISTRIVDDKKVIDILKYMIGETDIMSELPDHKLFKVCDRWDFMLKCSSYYFVPRVIHLLEYDDIGKYWCFINRSDFKNYDNEVNLFIDWIKPYLADKDEMFAYSRYEEDKEPTIYYNEE